MLSEPVAMTVLPIRHHHRETDWEHGGVKHQVFARICKKLTSSKNKSRNDFARK
jgi:hypothetical protein